MAPTPPARALPAPEGAAPARTTMSLTTFVLLGLLTLVILVLALLLIYLSDRFNSLERQTQDLMRRLQDTQAKSGASASGPYAGLSGKALWEAVCGQETGGLDELTLDGVRKRYRLLLDDHLQSIFQAGASDGARGLSSPPANTRMVRTPKAQVESWLPPELVDEIYQCGQGYVMASPEEMAGLRQRLDQAYGQVWMACNLEPGQPASSLLMPPRPQDAEAGSASGPAAGVPAIPATSPAA